MPIMMPYMINRISRSRHYFSKEETMAILIPFTIIQSIVFPLRFTDRR